MTLYQLNLQMQEILDMAETGDFDEDLIKGTLEGVEGEIEAKLDSYGVIVNELQDDIEKIDKELKRLTAKKKTITNSIDYLKKNVMETMKRMDKRTIKGVRFSWTITKNGGKLPIKFDDIFSVLALDDKFQICDIKPDKDAIRTALEAGENIPGVHLGERGESLRLR